MFSKLDEILARYKSLTEKLSDADVLADTAVYQKCCKEHADLEETAQAYERYLSVKTEMEDAFALAEEEEGEMKKMLLGEGYACKEKLAAMAKDYPFIQCVRGRGLMLGIVLDRPAGPLSALLMKKHLITLTAGETVLRLLPPLTITQADADAALSKIAEALAEFAKSEEI